ncbi:hypothetical protein E1H18_1081 [Caulobacter sp. RHG1]|nr:hypothetical protein [Caulobacter sp. RHG1]
MGQFLKRKADFEQVSIQNTGCDEPPIQEKRRYLVQTGGQGVAVKGGHVPLGSPVGDDAGKALGKRISGEAA